MGKCSRLALRARTPVELPDFRDIHLARQLVKQSETAPVLSANR
jgi:hypothetical protein